LPGTITNLFCRNVCDKEKKSLIILTPGHGPATVGQRREGDFEEMVHALNVLDKVVKLKLEHLQSVFQHRSEVGFPQSD